MKLHHVDPDQRDAGSYAAEAWFYRELASRVDVPVPCTYVAQYDERDKRLVIVQEFLSDGRIGSASGSLAINDLERVLASLATLHAGWWNSPDLHRIDDIRDFEPVILNAIANLRDGALDVDGFLNRFADLMTPSMARCYALMPVWMERVAEGVSGNATLIHLDCSAKNVFIPRDPRCDPVLFDWALFRRGNPAFDVATLLVYSMDPSEHDRILGLVRVYHDLLTAKGVHDYAFDTLWNDVRFGFLWRMVAPVFNASVGTPARDAHARAIIPLVNSAVLSTRSFDVVDPPIGDQSPVT